MEAYSLDLRQRVVNAVEEGLLTRAEIAEQFGVSESWIRRLLQRRREKGSLAPLPQRAGRPPGLDERDQTRLRKSVQCKKDATLAELRQMIRTKVSLSTIWRTLQRMKITFKKKVCGPKSKTVRM